MRGEKSQLPVHQKIEPNQQELYVPLPFSSQLHDKEAIGLGDGRGDVHGKCTARQHATGRHVPPGVEEQSEPSCDYRNSFTRS
jgi:hypothetical protein